MSSSEKGSRLGRLIGSRWVHWGVLALVMLFFMRGWLNGRLPASPRMEMIVQFATTWFILDELRQGRLLTPWNPWEFGGFPWIRLLAWPLYLILALISWAGIPMEAALKALAFVGFAASGVAMYELARLLTGRWQAGLVAGLVYMISPFHIQMAVDWWEFIAFWALLPLPFLFYELALRRPEKRVRFLALAALCLGLFPLVSPERTFVSSVWFGAYALLREVMRVARREASWRNATARLAAVAGMAALVALVMMLPAAKELPNLSAYLNRGMGAEAGSTLLADYSASPRLLLGALLQRLKIPVDRATLPTIWKSFGSLFAWYLGWPALGLAALGLLQIRRCEVWMAALLGGLALWLSFGPTVPFNPFQQLPLFSTLMPFRGLMLVVFFLSVLAGFGVITAGQIFRRTPLGVWAALALLVVIVDFRPAGDVFGSVRSYFTEDERAAYAFLADQTGDWRLWEPRGVLQGQYVSSYSLPLAPVKRFRGHEMEGLPIHTWELMNGGDEKVALNLLSVRFAMARKNDPEYARLLGEVEEAGFTAKAWDSPDVEIWEKPDFRPFAILLAAQGGQVEGRVEYVRESPTRIRVHAAPANRAVLTISEAWYPHWRVFVDGNAAPLLRVDHMLQGVELEAGEHEVLFAYAEPLYIAVTRALSGLAALALLLATIWNPKVWAFEDGVKHAG